jgi:hypothetical protein
VNLLQDYDEIENFILDEFVKVSKNNDNIHAVLQATLDAGTKMGYTDENMIRALKDLYERGFTNFNVDWSALGPSDPQISILDSVPLTPAGYRYWKENSH